ncbi:MAG: hypothetical protein NZ936_16675, partial [Alphaproteobacteria bacterium]|nr:hypothetical protein [Alphaproteobacteria bacterium]
MNDDTRAGVKTDWRQNSIYMVSLFVAFVGLINSYPSYWIVPRMGPFTPEIVRPLMLGAAVLVVILRFSFAVGWAKSRPSLKSAGLALDLLILAVITFALWRFSVDMLEMLDSMVVFDGSHAAIALIASTAFIVLCWRVWGAALAIVGIVALFYYFTGPYWPGIFRTAPFDILSSSAEDLWFNL